MDKDCQRFKIRDLVRNQPSHMKPAITPEVSHPGLANIGQRRPSIQIRDLIRNQGYRQESVMLCEISDLTRSAGSAQYWTGKAMALLVSRTGQRSKIRDRVRNQRYRVKSAISPEVPHPGLADVQQRWPAIQSQRSRQESVISPGINDLA